ncbi:MAG: amidohydrolase, partial [Caulobacter sp.]|nr:amidohydrolase [Caulobacter sp.]
MTTRLKAALTATALSALLAACATTGGAAPAKAPEKADARPLSPGAGGKDDAVPFASTYAPLPGRPTAIVGATVLTADGRQIEGGVVVFADGKLIAVGGPETAVPTGYDVIDGKGKYVTPGVIDAHSHLGVYPSPGVSARSDGNEATDPNTAQVWSEHSIWPQDPGFNRARAGGVTTLQILPGSANLFGGRSVTVRNVPSVTMQGMKFPNAPYGLKMACGENPKRVYGGK